MAAKNRILELARAAATPRYDAPPPPPSEGSVDGGEGLCERAAPAAPPRRMTAPSQAPPRAAPTPFSLRSDKGNPFMETADDQARYKIDYAAALDLDQCEPTAATRGTYDRIAGIFTRKWDALGLGRPPEVKTPCSLLHLPGFNASSAAATRDAFKWAWDKTDGGKLSSLEEALNEYFFELTDLGRLLAEAWAEQAFSDDVWEVVRPMVRVDLVFGGVQAGPEAVVFWHRAASEHSVCTFSLVPTGRIAQAGAALDPLQGPDVQGGLAAVDRRLAARDDPGRPPRAHAVARRPRAVGRAAGADGLGRRRRDAWTRPRGDGVATLGL